MTLRRYEPEDYPTYLAWCQAWNFTAAAPGLLPPFGVVVDDCVVAFMAEMEPATGVVSDLVSDPAAPKEKVRATREVLITVLEGRARDRDLQRLVFWTSHPTLVDYAQERGMTEVKGVRHFRGEV